MICGISGIDRFKANKIYEEDGMKLTDGVALRDISRAELILGDRSNRERASIAQRYEQHLAQKLILLKEKYQERFQQRIILEVGHSRIDQGHFVTKLVTTFGPEPDSTHRVGEIVGNGDNPEYH